MQTKNLLITTALAVAIAACSQIPKEAYQNRGDPNRLIEKSSKAIGLRLLSPASIDEMTRMLDENQPTRAELKCTKSDALCTEAGNVLRQFGVPTAYSSAEPDSSVSLIYEKVQARECNNRYIDNVINPYNLNHAAFGCSVSTNLVQMVADKRQFTDPKLMDYSDASKAQQSVGFYETPGAFTPSKVDPNFSAIATQQTISTDSGGGR